MRKAMILVGLLVLTVGCALTQAKTDYDSGKNTPLAEHEVSPQAAAEGVVAPFVPYLPEPLKPVAGVAVVVLTLLGTWQRGRRIRKGQDVSAHPFTGAIGKAAPIIEKIVQNVANISQGAFEVGPEGSGLRRAWKVLVAGTVAALSVPAVQDLVVQHPTQAGTALTLLAGLAALEKELSKVLPVKPE